MRATSILCTAAAIWLSTQPAGANSQTEIDLVVVHTAAVTTNYGGTAGVEAHALASVASVNDALADSAIPVQFNLVAVEEIPYTESATSFVTDLEAISGKSDPIDPIHSDVLALRDTYGADLVTLFRDGPAGGTAGLAYLPDPQDDRVDLGYSVVSDASALNQLVLAHEFGHNMGSAHARGEAGNAPPTDEARGYIFSANGTDYGTIMSIDTGTTRIAQYSNPAVLFEGEPTGRAVGDPDAADNATAFATSTPVIANFRRTQTEVPSFLEEPVGDTVVAGAGTRLRARLRGLPPLTVEWFQGEIGDTSLPLTSTETELERGGTESTVDIAGVSQTTGYWLRVTNPNDTHQSRTVRLVLVPAPTGAVPLVEQAVQEGAFIVDFDFEQTMTVPEPAFLETIRLTLAKQGNPPNPSMRFETIDGTVISEVILDTAQVGTGPTPIDFNIGRFVAPDTEYRVVLAPAPNQDASNFIAWFSADQSSVVDPNVGDSNLGGNPRLMFSLLGTEAWTYHTWLAAAEGFGAADGGRPDDQNEGLPNLIRYALGGDFSTPAAQIRPQLQALESTLGGPEAALRYTQRPAVVDVAFIVEQSSDLVDWTPVPGSQIEELAPTPEGNASFEARVPYNGDRLFLRINTENPPTP
jgi:hypothetical protein